MKLSSDILYQSLSQHTAVKCIGKSRDTLSLHTPVFYDSHCEYQNDMVYVGRSGELPSPPHKISCLIISVGGNLPKGWDPGQCCAFVVSAQIDILTVFNILQQTFARYSLWSDELWRLLDSSADYEKMLRNTAILFDRWLVLTNNKLEIVASSYPREPMLLAEPLSLETVQHFAGSHKQNTEQREPFLFNIGDSTAYCINIYVQKDYIGILTIQGDSPPLSTGEKQLFLYFSQFVIKAVKKTVRSSGGQMVTLRSLFSDLLNCYPVSEAMLRRVLGGQSKQSLWLCAALSPAEPMRNIPGEYFCTQLEAVLKRGYAISVAPYIALFVPLESTADVRISELDATFRDMGLYAGICTPFEDITQARGFYRQAVIALQAALEHKTEARTVRFDEIVLSYILKNGLGELQIDQVVPRELWLLRNSDAYGMEYWNTLKVYLNNEMNASQTARDLYIHRTTLLKRLARMEELLDLSTPEKRMYLRCCVYLLEYMEHSP